MHILKKEQRGFYRILPSLAHAAPAYVPLDVHVHSLSIPEEQYSSSETHRFHKIGRVKWEVFLNNLSVSLTNPSFNENNNVRVIINDQEAKVWFKTHPSNASSIPEND